MRWLQPSRLRCADAQCALGLGGDGRDFAVCTLSMKAFFETCSNANRLLNGSALLRAIAQSEGESTLSVEIMLTVILHTDVSSGRVALCR